MANLDCINWYMPYDNLTLMGLKVIWSDEGGIQIR